MVGPDWPSTANQVTTSAERVGAVLTSHPPAAVIERCGHKTELRGTRRRRWPACYVNRGHSGVGGASAFIVCLSRLDVCATDRREAGGQTTRSPRISGTLRGHRASTSWIHWRKYASPRRWRTSRRPCSGRVLAVVSGGQMLARHVRALRDDASGHSSAIQSSARVSQTLDKLISRIRWLTAVAEGPRCRITIDWAILDAIKVGSPPQEQKNLIAFASVCLWRENASR